jgi:hypothetical protein
VVRNVVEVAVREPQADQLELAAGDFVEERRDGVVRRVEKDGLL